MIAGRLVTPFLLLCASFAFGQQWTRLDASGPTPRRNAAAVYDPVEERVVLFGGRGSSGDLDDVWAFDLTSQTWRQIPTDGEGPTPRFTHNAVYDAAGHRMLIWSGRMIDANGSTLLNDVWALDLATHRWARLAATAEAPVARYGTAAVFDPLDGSLVTFAGFTTQGRFDDTWRFDPTSGTWRDVTPASPQPGERCLHAAAHDTRRHRMIMFGGQRGSNALDDAWALDLATDRWTELAPASQTGGRKFPAVAYDPVGDRFLAFGGERTDGIRAGDLWALDLQSERWSVLTTEGPAPRDGAVLVYVTSQSRLLLFGGTTSQGHEADTWSLPLEAPTTAVSTRESTGPESLSLAAYPNPFNASVVLDLHLESPGRLTIYDTLGQLVRNLGTWSAGPVRRLWDGRDEAGRDVASGVYLAVLESGSARQVTRLALLR
jgi:hypothetical protein